MMRYQRVLTPDSHPLTNAKKSTPPCYNGGEIASSSSAAAIEGGINKELLKFRSPSSPSNSPSPHECGGGGDALFQWGQKKRARVSRSLADESSSSSSANKMRRFSNKVQKRTPASSPGTATTTAMPSPPPTNGRSLRNCLLNKEISGFNHIRNLEERSGPGNGSPSRNSIAANRVVSRSTVGKRSPTPEKVVDKKLPCSGSAKDEKLDGSLAQTDNGTRFDSAQSEKDNPVPVTNVIGGAQKANEVIEWPRIYVALSRKEKEEDFMAMRGTKLPHRPKKRAKNVDKALQYCFPGMWLSDMTKSRYEVREKKFVKKQKRRGGLKGMENNMDTDSE